MHKKMLLEFILHKEFNSKERPSNKFVEVNEIRAGLVFGIPIECMIKQMNIVKRNHNIKVLFTPIGIFGSQEEINRLLDCFLISTQSN